MDDWDLDLEEELPESQSRRPSNQPRPTSPVDWIVITGGCYYFRSYVIAIATVVTLAK